MVGDLHAPSPSVATKLRPHYNGPCPPMTEHHSLENSAEQGKLWRWRRERPRRKKNNNPRSRPPERYSHKLGRNRKSGRTTSRTRRVASQDEHGLPPLPPLKKIKNGMPWESDEGHVVCHGYPQPHRSTISVKGVEYSDRRASGGRTTLKRFTANMATPRACY